MATGARPSRLTIYLCDSAMYQHRPLRDVVVHRALDAGLAGATVLRGVEGYGRRGDIHTARIVDASDHLPVAVVIVDDDEKLRDFVQRNDDCLNGRLVTLEPLELYAPPAAGVHSP